MENLKVLIGFDALINKSYLGLWERKRNAPLDIVYFKCFPLSLLNIPEIYETIINKSCFEIEQKISISNKLIDIKSLFFFLRNSSDRFYLEPFEIIGNGELEKADEKQISWLQMTHYKVYLISTLYEKLIDLFEIVFFQKETDHKRNKIGKKLEILWTDSSFDIVTKDENDILTKFRDKTRRGEVHGTSSIIRQLFKNEWNHLATEENAINSIVEKFYTKYNKGGC